jgi:hypothetical protein
MREVAGRNPLAMAFLFSLVIHCLLFGTWRVGNRLHWWQYQPTWLMSFYKLLQPSPKARVLNVLPTKPQPKLKEIPLTFIEVDPVVAVVEPPKDAKYYGAHSAKAAQPDPVIDTTKPKIDGKQDKVPRLVDTPRPVQFPLQPTAPEPKPAQTELKPKAAETPGDLALAKPSNTKPDATMGEAPVARPRTLAAARQAKGMIAGEKMRMDGGVNQRGRLSVDVKGTPFGAYDAAFIAAVQQRWYDLLDNSQVVQRSGKVVLQFRLIYDGRITDMRVNDNNVGELLGLLCQRAVLDPAPYAKWPSDMRRLIGENFREVTFTFYYN